MKRVAALIATVILAAPFVVSAHGGGDVLYFEFAPDGWASTRHAASSGAMPYQLFETADTITLTGFDLWIDNTGSLGSILFTIADSQGTTLTTQAINVPSLPQVPGGNKLHVDLTSTPTLQAQQTYSIKIESALTGLGIYYADRITLVEHNRELTSQYATGVARLGQVEQNFTFKFALYAPPPSAGGSPPAPLPPPPPPPSIIISNARVVAVTSNSVTFAWTTNTATDSGVAVRTQLNPKFIFASNYDPVLELEHTISVGGLTPDVYYFIDAYSSQGGGQGVTTYTTSFHTPPGPPADPNPTPPPPPPTPNPEPNPTPPPPSPNPNPPPPSPNPNPNPSPNPNPNPTPGPTPGPGPGPTPPGPTPPGSTPPATPGGNPPPPGTTPPSPPTSGGNPPGDSTIDISRGGGGGGGIYWTPPNSEPSNGYRIDIFDANHTLQYQFIVPAGSHSKTLPTIGDGTYNAIVYANNNDVFTKIGAPLTFTGGITGSLVTRNGIILTVLLLATAGGYAGWKIKQKKKAQTSRESES